MVEANLCDRPNLNPRRLRLGIFTKRLEFYVNVLLQTFGIHEKRSLGENSLLTFEEKVASNLLRDLESVSVSILLIINVEYTV